MSAVLVLVVIRAALVLLVAMVAAIVPMIVYASYWQIVRCGVRDCW